MVNSRSPIRWQREQRQCATGWRPLSGGHQPERLKNGRSLSAHHYGDQYAGIECGCKSRGTDSSSTATGFDLGEIFRRDGACLDHAQCSDPEGNPIFYGGLELAQVFAADCDWPRRIADITSLAAAYAG